MLVTGGGRGLGLEIAHGLAASGARVLLNGRSAGPLEDAAGQIAAAGGAAEPLTFDIADEAAVDPVSGNAVLCGIPVEITPAG